MTAGTTEALSGPAPLGAKAHAHGAGAVPEQSRAERQASFDVADFAVPTGREEIWRFTPMDRLRELHTGSFGQAVPAQFDVQTAGVVTSELVTRDDERLGRAGVPEDRVAAQAWSGFEKALVVTVPRGNDTTEPTVVTIGGRAGETSFEHVLIVAEREATGVVVLDHRGSGTHAGNLELDLADASHLTVVSIHDWADDAVHLTQHHARLGRDARLKHVVATLGGDLVRVVGTVSYDGPGGDAELIGLYFADAGQHLEHRLFVDHAVPHCKSRALYKGALQGAKAHTVWIGDVLIRKAAEGTDTYEMNRNLILTSGARADSVPNLEIETGEIVGAGHASATGRFDDEQLFYLLSRGIPPEVAKRLVVRGFFGEVLLRIGIAEVVEKATEIIERELAIAGI